MSPLIALILMRDFARSTWAFRGVPGVEHRAL
jgi:hypothetical protein